MNGDFGESHVNLCADSGPLEAGLKDAAEKLKGFAIAKPPPKQGRSRIGKFPVPRGGAVIELAVTYPNGLIRRFCAIAPNVDLTQAEILDLDDVIQEKMLGVAGVLYKSGNAGVASPNDLTEEPK